MRSRIDCSPVPRIERLRRRHVQASSGLARSKGVPTTLRVIAESVSRPNHQSRSTDASDLSQPGEPDSTPIVTLVVPPGLGTGTWTDQGFVAGRPRTDGRSLRIRWSPPLTLGAQVPGQVDESKGRCRDCAGPPVPAAIRHGGHDQASGQHDFHAGEPPVATTGETLNPRCERIWPMHHEGNARTSDGWSAPPTCAVSQRPAGQHVEPSSPAYVVATATQESVRSDMLRTRSALRGRDRSGRLRTGSPDQ